MNDRKYGQRGYQEDGGERERARQRPEGPRPERLGPRGRGLGQPTVTRFRCRDCGTECDPREVTPSTTCLKCKRPLHACVNCRFFDPSAPRECRAEISERLPSKTKANDCEHWSAKVAAELGEGKPQDAKSAFDALFKGF